MGAKEILLESFITMAVISIVILAVIGEIFWVPLLILAGYLTK